MCITPKQQEGFNMNSPEEIGKIVRSLRGKESLRSFAERCDVSHTTIDNIEKGVDFRTGKPTNPSAYILTKIAKASRVSIEYILGTGTESNENPYLRAVKTKRFKMLGEIACGQPIFASEEHDSYVDASAEIEADYCLTAKGDSMIGARINDGDVVFIKEQCIVDNGEIAAVVIDGEATLKRWYYYPEKHKLVLTPENSAYEPLVYINDELNTITCLGKAVCFMSKL